MTNDLEYDLFELESRIQSNCSFIVGSTKTLFKCNKRILALGSPVFYKMFFGALKENTENSIPLPDINPNAFYIYLQFIYMEEIKTYHHTEWADFVPYGIGNRGYLELSQLFPHLYYISDKYLTPEFWNACVEIVFYAVLLKGYLLREFIYDIYTTACATDAKKLIEICEKKFRFSDDQLNDQKILNLPIDHFTLIIKYSFGHGSVSRLFRTIDKYVSTNNLLIDDNNTAELSKSEARKKISELFDELLEDEKMTKKMFTLGPASSALLSDDRFMHYSWKFYAAEEKNDL